MGKIVTLTTNPMVDTSSTINSLQPNIKLRCADPIFRAGGGGLNVSRALHNLGQESTAIFLEGGHTGACLNALMVANNIIRKPISIQNRTRENLTLKDKTTQLEYRFCVPGPSVGDEEWQESLLQIEASLSEGDYLVASGKLTTGIPDDYYVRVSEIAKRKKTKFILDTSGRALIPSLAADIHLFKPNLAELSALCKLPYLTFRNVEKEVADFMKRHRCKVMVVSLGARGALLATHEGSTFIQAPVVPQKSIIGAGDSMVGGMLLYLSKGKSILEMAQYGVACGTSATMRSGTQLCQKEDVDKIFEWILENHKK